MISRQIYTLLTAPVLVIGLALGGSVSFASESIEVDSTEHKFELAKQYYGQCSNVDSSQFDNIQPQLNAFTDMEIMADTMADPVKFMQLMAVVNDPQTIHTMTKCATEPVMWDTWMRGMTDFNKMGRVMGRFMNPNIYFSWMTAMANPVFYQPVTSLADPNWYTPRMNWMMNPQSMQPMFNMMNMGQFSHLAQPQQSAATGQ